MKKKKKVRKTLQRSVRKTETSAAEKNVNFRCCEHIKLIHFLAHFYSY